MVRAECQNDRYLFKFVMHKDFNAIQLKALCSKISSGVSLEKVTLQIRVHHEIMVKTEILGSTLLGAPKCSTMNANSFCQFVLHLNVI